MRDLQLRGYIDLFMAYAGVCVMALIATHVFAERLAGWTLAVEIAGAACIAIAIALRVWLIAPCSTTRRETPRSRCSSRRTSSRDTRGS